MSTTTYVVAVFFRNKKNIICIPSYKDFNCYYYHLSIIPDGRGIIKLREHHENMPI